VTTDQQEAVPRTPADRVNHALTAWFDYLPPSIRRVVPREFAGYTVISLSTFALDMLLLALLRHRVHMPVPLAVSISYAVGFAVNYVLNRTLNFQSHAPVAGQVLRYSVVVAGDFALTIGVTSGLAALGVDLRFSRLLAGGCVGIVTFLAYRWWVFRR
jgi:putative flippase GtrA